MEVVALAGRAHVVVAVGPDLDRAAVFLGGNGRDGRKNVGLGFLAAETTAHAAHVDGHRIRRHAENGRNHVLRLSRMLRRRVDENFVVLAGDGERDLPFQIEVILAADTHLAFEDVLRLGEAGFDVAPLELERIDDQRIVGGRRFQHVGHMRQVAVLDLDLGRRAAGRLTGGGDDGKDRLAVELHLVGDEDRLIVLVGRADVVFAGNVGRRQHADHAFAAIYRFEVGREDISMRPLRQAEIAVQRALGFRSVVDIFGRTRHMLVAGFVPFVFVHAAADAVDGLHHVHGFLP
ncbi:hypothetical protein D9M72_463160 [compost metagenome]